MKAFLLALGIALHEFLTSKKVITAVVTFVVEYFVKDPAMRTAAIALGVTTILGFAASDVGKSKAIIEAASPKPALTLVPMSAVPAELSAPITLAPLVPTPASAKGPAPGGP